MERNNYYVYLHRAKGGIFRKGKAFYVGKGTGKRAWREDARHTVWKRYVSERLNGKYTVEIVQDGLSEEAALDLEDELIQKYGSQLINWENPGRGIDYRATARVVELRKESQRLVSVAKATAKDDPVGAVDTCRKALALVHEYSAIETETGLVAELSAPKVGSPTVGDPEVIYRLALILKQSNRLEELVSEVDRYFERYPDARNWKVAERTIKMRDKAASKLA